MNAEQWQQPSTEIGSGSVPPTNSKPQLKMDLYKWMVWRRSLSVGGFGLFSGMFVLGEGRKYGLYMSISLSI